MVIKKTFRSGKILLAIAFVSYLFIVFTLEKWNMFLGIVILMSPVGVPYFPEMLYFIFGYLGVAICGRLLISRKPLTRRLSVLRWGIICLYVPLIVYHSMESFSISKYDSPFLIIPEIIFLVTSVLVFVETFKTPHKNSVKLT